MTVCEEAVHLPLPQQQNSEEQLAESPLPSFPSQGDLRVPKADPSCPEDERAPAAAAGSRTTRTVALDAIHRESKPSPDCHHASVGCCHGRSLSEGEIAVSSEELQQAFDASNSSGNFNDSLPPPENEYLQEPQSSATLRKVNRPAETLLGNNCCSQSMPLGKAELALGQRTTTRPGSRDVEVQTLMDIAITQSHLAPLMEAACQTGQPLETEVSAACKDQGVEASCQTGPLEKSREHSKMEEGLQNENRKTKLSSHLNMQSFDITSVHGDVAAATSGIVHRGGTKRADTPALQQTESDIYSLEFEKSLDDGSRLFRKEEIRRTRSLKEQGLENFSFLPDEESEMQVMVNSLTPVLHRRKMARRSLSHTGASTGSNHSAPSGQHLQALLAAFVEQRGDAELLSGKKQADRPSDLPKLSSKASPAAPGDFSSKESSLFIKPTFARTWHGPVQDGGSRATPRMGMALMSSDLPFVSFGQQSSFAAPAGMTHVHTLPVISRTLLDALHKRYCSYQYSTGGRPPMASFRTPAAAATQMVPTPNQSPRLGFSRPSKLNSEGESDTASSAATSTQSSPRVPHNLQFAADQVFSGSPDSSPSMTEKRHGQRQKEEVKALEACQWLRAAGFPQYAQMFEDGLFPVDLSEVQRDHDFLDSDSIQSVIRRLNILNTCAVMKIDPEPCKKADDESDEEDLCALSDRWEYQKAVRRWSRKDPDLSPAVDTALQSSSSHDSLLGEDSGSHTDESPVLDSKMPHRPASQQPILSYTNGVISNDPPDPALEGLIQGSDSPASPRLHRAASERLKSALKKMESFKKKSKKIPFKQQAVEISGPVIADQEGMQAKLQHLNCVDITTADTDLSTTIQQPFIPVAESTPDNKITQETRLANSSALSHVSPIPSVSLAKPASVPSHCAGSSSSSQPDSSSLSEYYSAHSQLLANFQAYSNTGGSRSNESSLMEIFLLPQDHKPGSFPRHLNNGYIDTTVKSFQAPSSTFPTTAASAPVPCGSSSDGDDHKVAVKSVLSRVSVYDNFPHQHTESATESNDKHPDPWLRSGHRPQVKRSLSDNSGTSGIRTEADAADKVRSRNNGVTDKAKQQTSLTDSTVEGSAGSQSSESARASSVTMEEFDIILQNLYRDISNLSRAIGDNEDRGATYSSMHRSQVSCGSSPHNGDVGYHVDNSASDSLRLETQLLQTSASETDSLQLGKLSDHCVDDSMEGEEAEADGYSQTTSSQDSSDEIEGSADDTLDHITMATKERRDSGVGSSLTRASSERKRKKIRWESFQKSHRPSRASRELQIGGLSVYQLLPLRQFALLKLTAIMEKCSPSNRSQWSWSVPRFMKRLKAPQFSERNVFGVPFTVTAQRTGQPLPQCVLYAMRYLRRTSHDAVGIFRKSGVRSRIQKLRDLVELHPDAINFDELQPYDVADLLKQYFRELPECLLTNKLSDTFRSIFTYVPSAQRLEALQTAVILLPEENREVLHSLLLFLSDIAQQSDKHQMNASNLAVCFAPSLFNLMGNHTSHSPRRQRKTPGVPDPRELLEQKAVHECFTYMITECKKLFMVPPSMYSRLHLSTLSNMEPVHLDEFYAKNKQPGPDFRAFGEEHIQILLKEVHDKSRSWLPTTVGVPGVEAMQRKPQDGHPLRQWKCSIEIEAPPIEVLNRILHERHKWDDDMLSWEVVERLDRHSDIFHYVLNSMAPHPPRHFMVIRYWRPDLVKGACALVSKSVEYSGSVVSAIDYDQGVRAVELGISFLMEHCGSGRSRLTYIARTDLRGRCPEWYNRVFGHMCANFLERLRDSFRQDPSAGPETKV